MLVIGYDATYGLKLASAMSVVLCVGGALVLKPFVVGANKNGTEKDEKNWKDIVVNRSKFIVGVSIFVVFFDYVPNCFIFRFTKLMGWLSYALT